MSSSASVFTVYPLPWSVVPGRVSHTVADVNGAPICCLPPFEWDRRVALPVQAAAATLLSHAPAMLAYLAMALDLMRRSDAATRSMR